MKYEKVLLSLQVNHSFTMKKLFGFFLLLTLVVIVFSSCERNCVCKNLDEGTQAIYYGAYSKSECQEAEDYYNTLHGKHIYECSYK